MIDIMPDDKEISKALNVLNSISDKLRYEKFVKLVKPKKTLIKNYLKNSNSFMTFPLQIMPLKIYIT